MDTANTGNGEGNTNPNEGKSVDQMLQEMLAEQQHHRQEMAALREQWESQKAPAPSAAPAANRSVEELEAERAQEISNFSHYCPGCGRLFNYLRECVGRAEAPHPPIEVVSTDELMGDDTSKHTAAPATTNLG